MKLSKMDQEILWRVLKDKKGERKKSRTAVIFSSIWIWVESGGVLVESESKEEDFRFFQSS